jgi:hypothetical protein
MFGRFTALLKPELLTETTATHYEDHPSNTLQHRPELDVLIVRQQLDDRRELGISMFSIIDPLES